MALSEFELKKKSFLTPIQSAEHMKDWIAEFLGLDMPLGHIDPDSNSSPVAVIYELYCAIRDNKGGDIPEWVVLSSRDSYKTLGVSILHILILSHFKLTVAHMAAIKPQSAKAIQYVGKFLRSVEPYLEEHGKSLLSRNTSNISIIHEDGTIAYITIIVCTLTGANSEHTNIMVIDEVDVVRFPQAYEEAKLIPGVLNGRFPLTIKTSTRKFAFGLMQKEIDHHNKHGLPVRKWNIVDITEYCGPERHLPDEPKVERYIHPNLPLRNISPKEVAELLPEKQKEFTKLKVHAGCAKCPLLPVCQMRLSERPKSDVGGLFKPIQFTINQFTKISPDMGEAQLLCRKPSKSGLVYGRFEDDLNISSVAMAYHAFTGEEAPDHLSLKDLVRLLHKKGIKFHAGVDWGFRHYYAIVISCVVPTFKNPQGEWWIIDHFAASGFEFDEMLKAAIHYRDRYKPTKWYADTAQPMFIKTFRKNRMPCRDFKKDILGGIEAARGRIVDAKNKRHMQVINDDNDHNRFVIDGFHNHHFKLDAQGTPTLEPDDEEFADVMDCIRYKAQNMFDAKTGAIVTGNGAGITDGETDSAWADHEYWMRREIERRVGINMTDNGVIKSSSGDIIMDFGSDDDI